MWLRINDNTVIGSRRIHTVHQRQGDKMLLLKIKDTIINAEKIESIITCEETSLHNKYTKIVISLSGRPDSMELYGEDAFNLMRWLEIQQWIQDVPLMLKRIDEKQAQMILDTLARGK